MSKIRHAPIALSEERWVRPLRREPAGEIVIPLAANQNRPPSKPPRSGIASGAGEGPSCDPLSLTSEAEELVRAIVEFELASERLRTTGVDDLRRQVGRQRRLKKRKRYLKAITATWPWIAVALAILGIVAALAGA